MENKKDGFFDTLSEIFNLSIYNPIELIKNSVMYGIVKVGISLGLKISLLFLSLKISGINLKNYFSDYFRISILNGNLNINRNINHLIFGSMDFNKLYLSNSIENLFFNRLNFLNLSLRKIGFSLFLFLIILIIVLIVNSLLEYTNIKILVESNKKNKIDYLEANRYVFKRKVKLVLFDFIFKYLVYGIFISIGLIIFTTKINKIELILFAPLIFLMMVMIIIYSNYINFLKVNLIISDKAIIESIIDSNKKIKEMKISKFIKRLFFIIFICIGINIGLSSVFNKINIPLINGVINIVIGIVNSAYFILISNATINKNLEYIEVRGKE